MSYIDKYARVVSKEMDRLGTDVTLIRKVNGVYNPQTSSVTQTEIEVPCRGMLFDLTLQSNGDSTKPSSLIEMGDKQLLLQPNEDDGFYQENELGSIYPNKDVVRINGKIYKIITFKQINPSTTNSVLWDCYIRG